MSELHGLAHRAQDPNCRVPHAAVLALLLAVAIGVACAAAAVGAPAASAADVTTTAANTTGSARTVEWWFLPAAIAAMLAGVGAGVGILALIWAPIRRRVAAYKERWD